MEEVALLLRLLLAAKRGDAESRSALLAEEGVDRAAAREHALLHRRAEQVRRSPGPDPIGADDPDPALGRAAPRTHSRDLQRLLGIAQVGLRAARQGAHDRQLLQELGGGDAGAQLDRVERRSLRALAG